MAKAKSTVLGHRTTFYAPAEGMLEVQSGNLFKSPPSKMLHSMKSWTRRFFVLLRVADGVYSLKYFKNEEKRGKALGEIDLSKISIMMVCPENNTMWPWIHNNFRCPQSCVIFLREADRDFFLIGENSDETDLWLKALYTALKDLTPQPEHNKHELELESRGRSISAPVSFGYSGGSFEVEPVEDAQKCQSMPAANQWHLVHQHLYDHPRMPPRKLGLERSEDQDKGDDGAGDKEHIYEDMTPLRATLKIPEEDAYIETDKIRTPSPDSTVKTQDDLKKRTADHRADGKNEHRTSVEMDLCVSQEDLRNHLSPEEAKRRESVLLQDDEIVAINDLHIDSKEEVEYCLKKLRSDKVKLTIRRFSCDIEEMRHEISVN
ncbi:pleckstrin homology domain-containing family S member 1-like isoform X2 [Denticeps clupeoides]|uniref:PH domain-containing protein n=1 Tax=Denticeps clupeoides TaxID=299321 RepID=A0AAY4DBF1_9TELE|nr:pleckstrin homology domain-containing family S member 1-like isoform X2 [Denticeps clupeoides]